jgi:chromosome segregation ATPase
MAALQERAERIQNQMNDVKQQCGASLDKQAKSLTASIENLVKQRVQLGSQIAQLEAQVEDLKSSAIASCGRNVKQYEDELGNIKQQMAALQAQKNTEGAQKIDKSWPTGNKPAASSSAPPAPQVVPGLQGGTGPRTSK